MITIAVTLTPESSPEASSTTPKLWTYGKITKKQLISSDMIVSCK